MTDALTILLIVVLVNSQPSDPAASAVEKDSVIRKVSEEKTK